MEASETIVAEDVSQRKKAPKDKVVKLPDLTGLEKPSDGYRRFIDGTSSRCTALSKMLERYKVAISAYSEGKTTCPTLLTKPNP